MSLGASERRQLRTLNCDLQKQTMIEYKRSKPMGKIKRTGPRPKDFRLPGRQGQMNHCQHRHNLGKKSSSAKGTFVHPHWFRAPWQRISESSLRSKPGWKTKWQESRARSQRAREEIEFSRLQRAIGAANQSTSKWPSRP